MAIKKIGKATKTSKAKAPKVRKPKGKAYVFYAPAEAVPVIDKIKAKGGFSTAVLGGLGIEIVKE